MPQRFEKNAPGDFYIQDGCCITCGVMHEVAPNLIDWHDFEPNGSGYVSSHCYVARQPSTPVEIAQILEAMEVMDADCLRYGGKNSEMIARIAELGLTEQIDALTPDEDPSSSPA